MREDSTHHQDQVKVDLMFEKQNEMDLEFFLIEDHEQRRNWGVHHVL
jgi:hypothetical protein